MGGPKIAGVGWAAGIERMAMLVNYSPDRKRPIAVIPVVADLQMEALLLAKNLRSAGNVVELGYRGNMSRRLKRANKLNAIFAVLIGPDEIQRGMVTLRNLDTGNQEEVSVDTLNDHLSEFL